jgi:hypothetical protein
MHMAAGGNGSCSSDLPADADGDDRERCQRDGSGNSGRTSANRVIAPRDTAILREEIVENSPNARCRSSTQFLRASGRGLYKQMKSRPAHFKRLLKSLRRKGRSHEDAEDLLQEAMLRLHLYGKAVPVLNEEAFLRRAANNLSIDQHRRDRLDLRKGVPLEEFDARTP